MKFIIILTPVLFFISLCSCSKEVVSLSEYEKVILENSLYQDFPLLQSKAESETLKKNQIKSLSLVTYRNENEPDSVTFIEYDTEGRIIYRTTTENVGAGCLPYWHRQEFTYQDNKLKRVNYYTFKYQTNSVLEKWMIKDTSHLLLFDWADYEYREDTTLIESGWATWKFIKDENGNIIKQTVLAKTNNQEVDFDYVYAGYRVNKQMMDNMIYKKPVTSFYEIEKNSVLKIFEIEENEYLEEYIYDSNGLPITRIHYLNGDTTSKAVISYSYY